MNAYSFMRDFHKQLILIAIGIAGLSGYCIYKVRYADHIYRYSSSESKTQEPALTLSYI